MSVSNQRKEIKKIQTNNTFLHLQINYIYFFINTYNTDKLKF